MLPIPAMMTEINIDKLIPYARNSRTHSDAQVAQIAASIKEFGFINPVIVDGDNGIIAGHGRVLAARKLGIKNIPVIEASHLTDAQKRAYIIVDNKLALNAGWDDELLRLELAELQDMDFDVDLLGFDAGELGSIAGNFGEDEVKESENDSGTYGIDYEEKFAIVVECKDEIEQETIFNKLTQQGLICKVLVN